MYVERPPDPNRILAGLPDDRLRAVLLSPAPSMAGRYHHWDDLRHRAPFPGLTHEETWAKVWLSRRDGRELPLIGTDGAPFAFQVPDIVFRSLHRIDQRCAGEIRMSEIVTAGEQARAHYLVNSLMEEAIRSSQLEGASTSRRVAKELLRSGRPPRDRGEQMILNNYRALQFMRERVDEPIEPGHLLELHRLLVTGTLDDDSAAGRLQTPADDRVAVLDRIDGTVLHVPPAADELPGRLDALCRFANASDDDEDFVHPVVRSIVLHLWLAYDHPFEDGNGRTARALFYWSMARRGYWLVEYLSISKIFRDAPGAYVRSFLLTETDGNDATYFLLHHLRVIEQALTELHAYLTRKMREVRDVEQLVRNSSDFNHRELALLGDAMRETGHVYTYAGHARSHSVTHETARTDLLHLHQLGLLERRGDRRPHAYLAPADLGERLRSRA